MPWEIEHGVLSLPHSRRGCPDRMWCGIAHRRQTGRRERSEFREPPRRSTTGGGHHDRRPGNRSTPPAETISTSFFLVNSRRPATRWKAAPPTRLKAEIPPGGTARAEITRKTTTEHLAKGTVELYADPNSAAGIDKGGEGRNWGPQASKTPEASVNGPVRKGVTGSPLFGPRAR